MKQQRLWHAFSSAGNLAPVSGRPAHPTNTLEAHTRAPFTGVRHGARQARLLAGPHWRAAGLPERAKHPTAHSLLLTTKPDHPDPPMENRWGCRVPSVEGRGERPNAWVGVAKRASRCFATCKQISDGF